MGCKNYGSIHLGAIRENPLRCVGARYEGLGEIRGGGDEGEGRKGRPR